ncbi:MAG: BatA domain-containing protein, partial [Bacteroidota bacterium]
MRFVHPQFLFALFALAIPILVHLFNFRRFKRVLFTNVRFLQEIKQDTRHRSRLKHLLVLASRLLALAFLVLAFAQPYLPAEKGTSRAYRNRVSIWIDNSFSMEARGTYGPLLEVARERARELVLSYPAADRFQLLTNDFEARDQRFVTREEFLQRLDEIRPTSAVRTLLEVAKRQQGAFASEAKANGEEFSAFFLSDFQSSLAGDGQLPADTNLRRYVVPFTAAAVANLSIDSCYLNTPYIQPGSTQELTVRLHNFGDKDLTDVPLKLHVNGSQRALSAVSVSGQSTTEIKLPFSISTTGFQQAVVSVTDHPVTFDDTFNFAFNVRPDVKVLCINGEARSSHIDALFANDAYFVYRTFSETQVDYNNLSSQQLVILNGLRSYASGLQESLRKYVENGGTLLVVPSTSTDVTAFNRFAAALSMPVLGASANDSVKVGRMETEHPMLSGVFEKGTAGTENLDLPLVH